MKIKQNEFSFKGFYLSKTSNISYKTVINQSSSEDFLIVLHLFLVELRFPAHLLAQLEINSGFPKGFPRAPLLPSVRQCFGALLLP